MLNIQKSAKICAVYNFRSSVLQVFIWSLLLLMAYLCLRASTMKIDTSTVGLVQIILMVVMYNAYFSWFSVQRYFTHLKYIIPIHREFFYFVNAPTHEVVWLLRMVTTQRVSKVTGWQLLVVVVEHTAKGVHTPHVTCCHRCSCYLGDFQHLTVSISSHFSCRRMHRFSITVII